MQAKDHIIETSENQLSQLQALYHHGEKIIGEADSSLWKQFAAMQDLGNVTESPYKYFKKDAKDQSTERFVTDKWYVPHHEFRSMRHFFKKLKKELGNDRYRDFGVFTPHDLRQAEGDFSKINLEENSIIYIPSGGIESVMLYEQVLAEKLKGNLTDVPVMVEDAKMTSGHYYDALREGLGISSNDKGALNNLGIYHSPKPKELAKKMVKMVGKQQLKESEWSSYKEDAYKMLPEGKPPVFIFHTGNKDKVNEIKRTVKYFGVTGYIHQADETGMHLTHSSEEKENVFSEIIHGKAVEAQESHAISVEDGSYARFKNGKMDDEQVFHGVHDGGLRFDPRVYEHELFKPIVDKLEAAGFSTDACNTKQIGEYAGGYKNLMELIYKIAMDLGKDGKPDRDALRVWEVDTVTLFSPTNPEKLHTYVSTQLNHVAVNVLLDPSSSSVTPNENKSSYYIIPEGEKLTQAELGRREGKVGFNHAEDKFLATQTGFGHVIWTMANQLNFTFDRDLKVEHDGGALDVTFFGNAPDQKKMLDKELVKTLKKEPFINLHERNKDKKLVKTPSVLSDIQEETMRHTDVAVFLPRKKTEPGKKFSDEEILQELEYLAKDGLMSSAWYVDGQDLQTPFATGKPVICYYPEELHKTHDFDYIDKTMSANARNFGGKGNPDNFRVYAHNKEELIELIYEHNLHHTRKVLPEQIDHDIPQLGKTERPMVAVYGSSSTEDPDIWKESRAIKEAMLMNGLGIVYGGMVRGVGKAFTADPTADNVTGLLNDEVFLERMKKHYAEMGWKPATIRSIFTPESKNKEGALIAGDYPQTKGIIDIEEVETPNIYVRMQAMKDGANENRVNGGYASISIIEPGSNGSVEEFYDKLIDLIQNPSDHKIVLWNKQKTIPGQDASEGYHEALINLLCERCNLESPQELERFGIYVRDDHKQVIDLIDNFSKEAAEMMGLERDEIKAQVRK